MPVVPNLPPFDAKAANNAWKNIKKPDGSDYAVFGGESFVKFVQGLRGQQDFVASHEVNIAALRTRATSLESITQDLDNRVAALEAQPQRPFPASG